MNREEQLIADQDWGAELKARGHEYEMPPGWCQHCCAPPDALYGCQHCGRPDYDDVVGAKYQEEGD